MLDQIHELILTRRAYIKITISTYYDSIVTASHLVLLSDFVSGNNALAPAVLAPDPRLFMSLLISL